MPRDISTDPKPDDIVTGKDIRVKVIAIYDNADAKFVVFSVAFRHGDEFTNFNGRQSVSLPYWQSFCQYCATLN